MKKNRHLSTHMAGNGRGPGEKWRIQYEHAEFRERGLVSGKAPLKEPPYGYKAILEAAKKMKPDAYLVAESQVVDRPTLFERAAELASKAAPYMLARLRVIEQPGEVGAPIQQRVNVECV